MVAAMHAEFERARPLLRMLAPGNGMTDLQRAGLARAVRKVRRGTPPGKGET